MLRPTRMGAATLRLLRPPIFLAARPRYLTTLARASTPSLILLRPTHISQSLNGRRCMAKVGRPPKGGRPPKIPYGEGEGEDGWTTDNTSEEGRAVSKAVRDQLARVEELRQRLASYNSLSIKMDIMAQYPDLVDLLEHVLDDRGSSFSMRTKGLLSYLNDLFPKRNQAQKDSKVPPTLLQLFSALSSQRLTGNTAKAIVAKFLIQHGVMKDEHDIGPDNAAFATFNKLLMRNLQCGMGLKVLQDVGRDMREEAMSRVGMPQEAAQRKGKPKPGPKPKAKPGSDAQVESELTLAEPAVVESQWAEMESPQKSMADGGRMTGEPTVRDALPSEELHLVKPHLQLDWNIALGKSVEPPFTEIFKEGKGQRDWYASRKLDGVRVITFLDFAVPKGGGEPWLIDIAFFSRAGNRFTSLENLESDIRRSISGCPYLRDMVERDRGILSVDERRRLVLDGEVCVMRPLTPLERAARQTRAASIAANANLNADHGTAGTLWEDNGFTEDFKATVSQVKRKYDQVDHPAYFLFDVLNWSEFAAGGTAHAGERTFAERQKDVQDLGGYMAREQTVMSLVRPLVQQKVASREELDAMVERAAREGWEGLILRKDTLYKGKRSSDVLKYKQWQDAEYTVVGIETSFQRLSVHGQYAEREALAAVVIEHHGHRVSVGTGFTTDQRLRYRTPEAIVGKQITVEYFGESEAAGRDEGVKSLRFPRVKKVWDRRRDI